jgi:hypothetical protein
VLPSFEGRGAGVKVVIDLGNKKCPFNLYGSHHQYNQDIIVEGISVRFVSGTRNRGAPLILGKFDKVRYDEY